jgi:hypothetical protein
LRKEASEDFELKKWLGNKATDQKVILCLKNIFLKKKLQNTIVTD